jgi:predicted nucleic acid-binding protein
MLSGSRAAPFSAVKHETGLDPAVVPVVLLLELARGLGLEHLDGARVEGDDPASLDCLRLADDDLATAGDQRATHGEPLAFEVDIAPPEADCFTAAHARHRDQVPERGEALILDGVEERP